MNAPLSPTFATPSKTTTGPARVNTARVIRAEWIKFTSVRSNLYTIGGAALATFGLGLIFSSVAGTGDGPPSLSNDALSTSLGGLHLSQLFLAILGVAFVTTEYSTGLIRTMFGVVPRRLNVLVAKVGVVSVVTFVAMTIAAAITFVGSMAVYADAGAALSLGDDGVIRGLAGTGLYGAAVTAMGVALGFLLRSTGSAIGVVIATLMVAPVLVGLLPADVSEPLGRILPSNAGAAMWAVGEGVNVLLSPTEGLVVLTAWVVGLTTAAAFVVRHRDA